MSMKGQVLLIGDYGNPFDTGQAKLVVEDLTSADVATALTDVDTFADSLKTGEFTACNVADVAVTQTTVQYKTKPVAAVNVDRQLICEWRTILDNKTRRLTVSGIAANAAVLEDTAQGERLTAAAKLTLAGYMNTLFGYTPPTNGVVILRGKVLQKP